MTYLIGLQLIDMDIVASFCSYQTMLQETFYMYTHKPLGLYHSRSVSIGLMAISVFQLDKIAPKYLWKRIYLPQWCIFKVLKVTLIEEE